MASLPLGRRAGALPSTTLLLRSSGTQHNRLPASRGTPRQINATERKIDRLVYELYDLTDEEIAVVEEAAG